MEAYLTEIGGIYDSYVSKTESLFNQYKSHFEERYTEFESTLSEWDDELLAAYTQFMANMATFQTEAESQFNTWFESIKDKLGEDAAGQLALEIEELTESVEELRQQVQTGNTAMQEALDGLDARLTAVENGWGINYNHDAVLGLCYMGAAWLSQHYERTVETAVLGVGYIGNSYLANTF